MLIDEQQGIELALAKPGDTRGNGGIRGPRGRRARPAFLAVIGQIDWHQHKWPFTAKDEIRQSTAPSPDTNIFYSIICWGAQRFVIDLLWFNSTLLLREVFHDRHGEELALAKLVERAGFEPA